MNLRTRQTRPRWHVAVSAAVAVVAIAGVAGCDQDEIHAYAAPPDPPTPSTGMEMLDGTMPPASLDELALTWDVPETWAVCESPPAFVIIAYDNPAHTVQTTVSRLAGTGGGALANINRWRQQINLPPVADLSGQPMTRLDLGDDTVAAMVDLESGNTRVLAAIYPREDLDETWFFKMTGPPEGVEAEHEAFVQLVLSARLQDEGTESNP